MTAPAHAPESRVGVCLPHRMHDGKAFRMLTILDEYTRECLAIVVARRLTTDGILARLTQSFARSVTHHCLLQDLTNKLT